MILQTIKLTNFRNHTAGEWKFHKKWNCITGLNGAGKSNLLDAMNVLSVLRSFNSRSDERNIRHDQDFFRVDGQLTKFDKPYQIVVKFQRNKKKIVEVNGKKPDRLADHIGLFPSLLIQPIDDYRLLQDSAQRRKLLDQAISQISKPYIQALIKYNRILKQRNALLKSYRGRQVNYAHLYIYDDQLTELVAVILKGRNNFIEQISGTMSNYYGAIAGDKEFCRIEYEPSISLDNYRGLLGQNIEDQIIAGRTTIGPHRDDITLLLNDKKLADVGSQGQRKSFLTALKVAIYSLLSKELEMQPLLFLDDLFDKLDNERVKNLLHLLSLDDFGQVFITDKDQKHLIEIMNDLKLDFEHIYLQHGSI